MDERVRERERKVGDSGCCDSVAAAAGLMMAGGTSMVAVHGDDGGGGPGEEGAMTRWRSGSIEGSGDQVGWRRSTFMRRRSGQRKEEGWLRTDGGRGSKAPVAVAADGDSMAVGAVRWH